MKAQLKKPKAKLCKCGKRLYTVNGIVKNKLCPSCRKEKKLIKLEKHKTTKSYDKKNYKTLHRKCWKLMSFIVRKKWEWRNDLVQCYTCGKIAHFSKMDCGHYWHDKLDFDERNLKPQCDSCNRRKSGNLAVYGAKLLRLYGEEWMKQLEIDAKNSIYKTQDLIKLLPLLEEEAKKYDN